MANDAKPATNRHGFVTLGDNKAIPGLVFDTVDGKHTLGVRFHIPTRQEGVKTFYKAVACSVEVTEDQRLQLIEMLGGKTT